MSTLAGPGIARQLLDRATSLLNGKKAAASTARRHRTILANAMDYAQELKLIDGNPIRALKWRPPPVSGTVDRRSVVNPRRARALLAAVGAQEPSGPRLVALFGLMYYAGLRPEEAVSLRKDNVSLPARVWNKQTRQWEDPPGAVAGER
jgi:integrase